MSWSLGHAIKACEQVTRHHERPSAGPSAAQITRSLYRAAAQHWTTNGPDGSGPFAVRMGYDMSSAGFKRSANAQTEHLAAYADDRQGASGNDSAKSSARADLDTLFRTHRPALLRFVSRKAGTEEASDIVQEIFVRAAGSRQQHRLRNPAGFLQRIATNLLIDRARRLARRNMPLTALDGESDIPSPPEQEWNMEAADLLRQYEDAVEAMSPKTRRVFLMHRVDEMSYREIHQALGISVATVEYHMMKALSKIAALVERER